MVDNVLDFFAKSDIIGFVGSVDNVVVFYG